MGELPPPNYCGPAVYKMRLFLCPQVLTAQQAGGQVCWLEARVLARAFRGGEACDRGEGAQEWVWQVCLILGACLATSLSGQRLGSSPLGGKVISRLNQTFGSSLAERSGGPESLHRRPIWLGRGNRVPVDSGVAA